MQKAWLTIDKRRFKLKEVAVCENDPWPLKKGEALLDLPVFILKATPSVFAYVKRTRPFTIRKFSIAASGRRFTFTGMIRKFDYDTLEVKLASSVESHAG